MESMGDMSSRNGDSWESNLLVRNSGRARAYVADRGYWVKVIADPSANQSDFVTDSNGQRLCDLEKTNTIVPGFQLCGVVFRRHVADQKW